MQARASPRVRLWQRSTLRDTLPRPSEGEDIPPELVFIHLRRKGTSSPVGYPLRKSFKGDILRGYLQNTPLVFIDLARKHEIWVYTQYDRVNMILCKFIYE